MNFIVSLRKKAAKNSSCPAIRSLKNLLDFIVTLFSVTKIKKKKVFHFSFKILSIYLHLYYFCHSFFTDIFLLSFLLVELFSNALVSFIQPQHLFLNSLFLLNSFSLIFTFSLYFSCLCTFNKIHFISCILSSYPHPISLSIYFFLLLIHSFTYSTSLCFYNISLFTPLCIIQPLINLTFFQYNFNINISFSYILLT